MLRKMGNLSNINFFLSLNMLLLAVAATFLTVSAQESEEDIGDFHSLPRHEQRKISLGLHLQRDLITRIVFGVVLLVFSILGVIGNMAVLIVIYTDPSLSIKNQISNITIVNLAITDVLTSAVACGGGAIGVIFDWKSLHGIPCFIEVSVNLGMMECSLNTMLVITLDRFIAVKWPLHYPQLMNETKLKILCALTWLTAINAGPMSASIKRGDWVGYDYTVGICDFIWFNADGFFWVVENYTFCFLPVIPILIMNIMIVRTSTSKSQAKSKEQMTAREEAEALANARILKSMIVVVATFFALSLPITTFRTFKAILGYFGYAPDKFPVVITMVMLICQILASIVNPLIYGLFRKDFRDAFFKLYKQVVLRK